MTTPTFEQQMEQVKKTLGLLGLLPTQKNANIFDQLIGQLESLELIHWLELLREQVKAAKGGDNEQD